MNTAATLAFPRSRQNFAYSSFASAFSRGRWYRAAASIAAS